MYELALLGGVALEGSKGPVSGYATQSRQLALLALLGTAGDAGLSRDKLLAYLFPESNAASARHSLTDAVYRLRKALGRDAVLGGSPTLRLNADLIRCDVQAFETALAAGDLEKAAGLYRGPFLDGFHLRVSTEFEQWKDVEARRLASMYEGALETLVDGAESAADYAAAVGWCVRLAEHDPLDSRAVLRLVEAQANAGDPANGILYAQQHADLLRRELGVEPPEELRALVERMRGTRSSSDADALEPPRRGTAVAIYRRLRKGTLARKQARHRAVVIGLGVLTLASLGLAGKEWLTHRHAAPAVPVEFVVQLRAGLELAVPDPYGMDLVFAPDGAAMAFAATDASGTRRLYLRRLADREVRQLPGTEGAYRPCFSPSGDWIAFSSSGRMQKVSVRGGAPQVVRDYSFTGPIAWISEDDMIVSHDRRLFSIPSSGAVPRPVAPLDSVRGETAQILPVGVGDGEHIVYSSRSRDVLDSARIGIAWLSKRSSRRLNLRGTYALGMLGDHLIYSDQSGTLWAVPLDLDAGEVTGTPVPVASGVMVGPRGAAVAALSATGTLAYLSGRREAEMVLVDSTGATPIFGESMPYAYPRYSPDGRQLAVTIRSGAGADVWLYDPGLGSLTQLSSGGRVNERPEWSPDGRHVMYRREHGRHSSIWWRSTDMSAPATPLLDDERGGYFEAVMTPDARALVYQVELEDGESEAPQGTSADLEYRMLDEDETPHPVANTRYAENAARLSPDGKLLAYVTEEFGQSDVVIQRFPGPGSRIRVSPEGGSEPVWAPTGHRLFYRSGGKFMVAEISDTPSLHVVSQAEFMDDVFLRASAPHANYDVAPDGKKLLVLEGLKEERPVIVVKYNWGAEVKSLLK